MNLQTKLALQVHYRKRLKECICETIAYRTCTLPERYLDGVHIMGLYPKYKVTLTGVARDTARQFLICMSPHFHQPSLLGASKIEYGNL